MKPRSLPLRVDTNDAVIGAGWEGVRARREGRARWRSRRRVLQITAPIAALAALIFFVLGRGGLVDGRERTVVSPAISPASSAARGRASADRPLALRDGTAVPELLSTPATLGTSGSRRVVGLDDGSQVELAASSSLRTTKVGATQVAFAVDSGHVTFDVKPGGPRMWVIESAGVVVKVLGTRFTVGNDAGNVEVVVDRGKVLVEGAGIPGGSRVLTAGESVSVARGAQEPVIPAGASPSIAAHATSPTVSPLRSAPTLAPAAAPVAAPVAAPTAASVPATDPMSRADTARRDGRPRDATRILTAMVDARDPRASLAAFTLGKIHAEDLADPAAAATWFERASALGLPAGLDEQALARTVECHARVGSKMSASRAAVRYLERHPSGSHAGNVRAWTRD